MPRTSLRAGFQGTGPLPYRLTDNTADRNSCKQRTAFVTITNRRGYLGYELITILGINKDQREYDTRFRDARVFDSITTRAPWWVFQITPLPFDRKAPGG